MRTMPAHVPTGTLARAPNGRAGVFHTVATMRRLADEAKTDPRIISTAVQIIGLTPEKDALGEVAALFEFVRDDVRYVRDVVGVETIATPIVTLKRLAGDCDDQSTLLAALLESVGYVTRFVVTGYRKPGEYQHVYLQAYARGVWIDLDPTEDGPLGYAPPMPVAFWIEKR